MNPDSGWIIYGDSPASTSYSDFSRINPCNSFAFAVNHVYLKGVHIAPGEYRLVYYDGNGIERFSQESVSVNGTDILASNYRLNSSKSASSGLWHVLVQPSSGYPDLRTGTYASIMASEAEYGIVAGDSFTVASTAIPEFPAIPVAVSIELLCCLAYWWMRNRNNPELR